MKTTRDSLVGIVVATLLGAAIAVAGSQGGTVVGGVPVFALAVGVAFAIQWIAFVPAYLLQTERFFDLTGSVTYILATALAFVLCPPADLRAMALAGAVIVWAVRLGTFLFRRIHRAGKDDRFDEIKPSPFRFLATWTIQGLWVSLTLAAALAALTSLERVSATEGGVGSYALDPFLVVGLALWAFGFAVEVTADLQKGRFRSDPSNRGRFIQSGLWSWSRHPNYFGEITLWLGIAIAAFPVLSGWQYCTLVSPLFVFLLITRVSGVPMLEKKADSKWGGQPDYEAYKAQTSLLFLRPPRRAGR
jgi:steroid 5-alpha reductase family enzyme